MTVPFLRSRSNLVATFGNTLTIPVSSGPPGNCVVVFLEGVDWNSASGGGSPILPSFLNVLYKTTSSGGFRILAYGHIPAGGLGGKMVFKAGPGMTTAGGWWGTADVIANVAWLLPGWIQTDSAGANYATYTRADLSSAVTSYTIWAQVELSALGVAQWFGGWANADMGFGLNSSNRPIVFLNNTLGNPIGNVAANAAVPDLATGKKIWLRGDIDVATGNVSYFYSYDPVPQFDSVLFHWQQVGTTVAGTNGGTTVRLTNSDTVFIGTRNTGVSPFGGKVFGFIESANGGLQIALNFSDPLPGAITLLGTANHLRSTSQDIGSLPFDRWSLCDIGCFPNNTNFDLPAIDIGGPDRMAYEVLRGSSFFGHTSAPITGPAAWVAYPDRANRVHSFFIKHVTRSRTASTDIAATPVEADGHYGFTYHWIAFIGRQPVVEFPPLPQSEVIQLGCADSYTVWVTEGDYETTIDEFRWSQINWERVLDDISTARVVLPDHLGGVNCVARLGGLLPWKFGLRIERNDREVWSGVVRNVQRQDQTIVVSAADKLARTQKRLAIRDLVVPYTNQDAGLLFADILNIHIRLADDLWRIDCPQVTVNVPVTRTLRPRGGKIAWDLISELLDTAIDGYMMNGVLHVWEPDGGWQYFDQIKRTLPGPYNEDFELVYGIFTEESFSSRPNWSIDGAGQGNFVLSATSDVGELGFRQFAISQDLASTTEFGALDLVDPSTLEVPEDQTPAETSRALKARADSLRKLRAFAPTVMEGGTLSTHAPIDVDNLRPGALWVTDVYDAGYGQLLSVVRLRRVSVQVTLRDGAIEEKINPVLYPPGWSGDMGAN